MIVIGCSIDIWPWSYFQSGNAEELVLSGECFKTGIEMFQQTSVLLKLLFLVLLSDVITFRVGRELFLFSCALTGRRAGLKSRTSK